jgi:hypothetical protein
MVAVKGNIRIHIKVVAETETLSKGMVVRSDPDMVECRLAFPMNFGV